MIKRKDRRLVIEKAATSVVPEFFAKGQRLKRWLQCKWDLTKILDHATMPCLLEVERHVPSTHFDLLDTHDTNAVQRCITQFAAKYEGYIDPREEILLSAAPKLEGDNTAFISRRDDLTPTVEMKGAGEYLSSTGMCNVDPLVEICLEHRDTLNGWDPVTERDEQEQWLPQRTVDELGRVGASVFYALTNIFDSRGRMYANTLGAMHPMYCKKSRGFMVHEHAWEVNSEQLEEWGTALKADTNLGDYDMEQLFHGKNPLTHLKDGGDYPLLCEVWHFLEAKNTGRTRAFSYIDAHTSGIILKELSTGWLKAVQNADSRLPGWLHARIRLARTLWTDTAFKAAIRGNGDMPLLETFIPMLADDLKSAVTMGDFGAGGTKMCLALLGNPVDGEDPFELDEVTLALPDAFSGWRPRTDNAVGDFIADFKKPLPRGMRREFPASATLNAFLSKYWDKHVGRDCQGTPPSWRMPDGYIHQPTRIRRNRDLHMGLHYRCPITEMNTTVQRKVLEPNPGLEMSPNVTHAMDALIMRICVLLMKQEGIPVIAIHDSVGVPIMFLRRANQLYVEATNWVISHNIWGQFGFPLFGDIPKLDPDCGLLRR